MGSTPRMYVGLLVMTILPLAWLTSTCLIRLGTGGGRDQVPSPAEAQQIVVAAQRVAGEAATDAERSRQALDGLAERVAMPYDSDRFIDPAEADKLSAAWNTFVTARQLAQQAAEVLAEPTAETPAGLEDQLDRLTELGDALSAAIRDQGVRGISQLSPLVEGRMSEIREKVQP